ncbi:hypothetical protein Acid345_2741 [Candidatus Koribacter versatilis Ellin345]|uniref:Uncharacterized protein n=1 Tax=Koribacter versatilis (strain Ellin345) TaxID=204669 RepID=Q1IN08_KORVE|nr:hypothetical protein [Candidatus Koribacter versatilis]ABF41742.1 hypothetical protein Acid345_2741 [Candidatus Koribacter versatilis Ellin345]
MSSRLTCLCMFLWVCVFGFAQQASAPLSAAPQVIVPRLIRFSGHLKGVSGTVGVTFTLHKSEEDDVALWTETQNVQLDRTNKYDVLLGATKAEGIPMELFISGEAQWLGIRAEGQAEQTRVYLVSVPYALRAAEADSLAGHPPSEFVTNEKLASVVKQEVQEQASSTGAERTATGAIANALAGTPTNFSGSTTDQVVGVTQSGTGSGVSSNATTGYALYGRSAGTAVYGNSTATATAGYGVYGTSSSPLGYGIFGSNSATTGTAVGIRGTSTSNAGIAVYGTANTATGTATGVKGITQSPDGYGVFGQNTSPTGTGVGVRGTSASTTGIALYGTNTASSGVTKGVFASVSSASGTAAVFQNTASGKLFSGVVGAGTEVFSVNGAGDISGAGSLNVGGTATFGGLVGFASGQQFPGTGALNIANTFTMPQTITGSTQTMLQVTGSASSASVIYGHSTDLGSFSSSGVQGASDGPVGLGVYGVSYGISGIGVEGNGKMNGVLGFSTTTSKLWNTYAAVGVHGDTGATNGVGVLGTVDGGYGVKGINNGTLANTAGTYGAAGPASGFGGIAGVWGDSANHVGTMGSSVNFAGVYGVSSLNSGVQGVNNSQGYGVLGTAANVALDYGTGVQGESFGKVVFPSGYGSDGVRGITHTTSGAGVSGINDAAGGVGVYGLSTNGGFGFATPSNVQQNRSMGGWVKAMVYVDPTLASGQIVRCFNSQLTGAASSTPPCGFTYSTYGTPGCPIVDFGFKVDDRFVSVVVQSDGEHTAAISLFPVCHPKTANNICLSTVDTAGFGLDEPFYLVVY